MGSAIAMGYSSIGLIGGTGLKMAALFEAPEVRHLETPYGEPSGPLLVGRLANTAPQAEGARMVALARHGVEHTIPPHKVNHRANLWGLRELGCEAVLGTSSTGGLREDYSPGTLVVPHDYLCTYPGPTFNDDKVEHFIPTLDSGLRRALLRAARELGEQVVAEGVYVQTAGPRLETKAETRWWAYGGHLIGMTMAHEAALAQELGLPYASLCRVDNYAHGVGKEELTADKILESAQTTGSRAQKVLLAAARLLASEG